MALGWEIYSAIQEYNHSSFRPLRGQALCKTDIEIHLEGLGPKLRVLGETVIMLAFEQARNASDSEPCERLALRGT